MRVRDWRETAADRQRWVPLEHAGELPAPAAFADVLAIDDAVERLAAQDPDQARIIELRLFAGPMDRPQE